MSLDIIFDYIRGSHATMLAVTHDYDLLSRFDETIDAGRFQAMSNDQR